MVRVNIEHVRKFSALMEDFKVSIKNISHHPDTEFGIANFGKQQGIPLEFSGSRNEQFTVSGPNFFFRSFSIKEPHVFGKDHLEVKFIIEGLKGARRKSDDKDFDILIELSGHIEVNTFFSKF